MLVTGSLSARERKAAAAKLAGTAPVLAVGTHALVQETAVFGRLGFVTIDEQHRFGVAQRAAISAKGESPDVLLMSATPIPRSLALTAYGDLDVSTLDERPAGRQPITTVMRPESARIGTTRLSNHRYSPSKRRMRSSKLKGSPKAIALL